MTWAEQMDLVTAEDWCGMWEGGMSVCECVSVCVCELCVMFMPGMSYSPPSEPENTQVEKEEEMWGRGAEVQEEEVM